MCNEQTLFHEKTSFNLKSLRSYFAHALTLALLITQLPHAIAGNGTSGGGGGVHKSGRYMTFYSAGVYTEFVPSKDVIDIPGLTALVNYVRNFPYTSESRRIALMDLLVPSSQHEYYKVKADQFDEATRSRLLAEFARVTGRPVDQLELFAVTDTSSGRTYLLPQFYLLTERDQMAILFHEAYWLMHPQTDYPTVVGAEMAFQAVMEQPENMNRVYQLFQYWGSEDEVFRALVAVDLAGGALKGLSTPDGDGIPVAQLFGSDYLGCVQKMNISSDCLPLLRIHVFFLTQQYPKSLFLRKILTDIETSVYLEYSKVSAPDDALPQDDQTHKCLGEASDYNRFGYTCSNWGLPTFEIVRTSASFLWKKEEIQFLPIDWSKAYVDLSQVSESRQLLVNYRSEHDLYAFKLKLVKYGN